jgi:hypothetical protein
VWDPFPFACPLTEGSSEATENDRVVGRSRVYYTGQRFECNTFARAPGTPSRVPDHSAKSDPKGAFAAAPPLSG